MEVNIVGQCFSNYVPRSTSDPRGLSLWFFKKDRRKNILQFTISHYWRKSQSLEITYGNGLSLLPPVPTDILWNLFTCLPTTNSIYYKRQKRNLKHHDHGTFSHLFFSTRTLILKYAKIKFVFEANKTRWSRELFWFIKVVPTSKNLDKRCLGNITELLLCEKRMQLFFSFFFFFFFFFYKIFFNF